MKLVNRILVGSLCVTFVVGVGYISSYLTDADYIRDRVNIGKVSIELVEDSWDTLNGLDIHPNEVVSKDPVIVNNDGTGVYAGISVSGLKRMVDSGFKAGILTDEGVLGNGSDEVFCWNPKFTLVNNKGESLPEGEDNALSSEELGSVNGIGDKVYFAYKDIIDKNGRSEALFTGVSYSGEGDNADIRIVKYFTKDKDGTLYTTVEEGNYSEGEPYKNSKGEYVYKYKVLVNGVEQDTVYSTYDSAKEAYDSLIVGVGKDFNLNIESSAVQAINDGVSDWSDIGVWYKYLSSGF